MRVTFSVVALFVVWAAFSSCDPPPECQGSNVSYTRCIVPTLVANCSGGGCHGGDQPLKNLQLEKVSEIYDNIYKRTVFVKGESLEMVTPGKPQKSYLYLKMLTQRSPEEGDRMPPFPRPLLSPSQLKMFETWIKEGALNDDPNYKAKVDVKITKPALASEIKGVDFRKDIQPVLEKKCGSSGCHDATTKSAGLTLVGDFYDSIVGKPSSNSAYDWIKKSKPAESLIYVKLLDSRPQSAGSRMPPKGFDDLTEREKSQVWVWIEEGAKKGY